MINIKINENVNETEKNSKQSITIKDKDACCYLATEAFESLLEAYEENQKEEVFDSYVEVTINATEKQKYFVLGMVCTLLEDNDMCELSHVIKTVIFRSEEAIVTFVNHFIAESVAYFFFDEEDEFEEDGDSDE